MSLSDAYHHLRAGEAGRAEKTLRCLLKGEPRNADAWVMLAQIYGERGRLPDCIEAFTRAAALRPDDPSIAYNRGVALTMSGRLSEALEAYRALTARHPDHVQARQNLAGCLISLGQAAAACVELRSLRLLLPQSADIFINLVSALIESGQQSEALNEINSSEIAAAIPQTGMLRGRVLNGLLRFDEAIAVFQTYLDTHPKDVDALNGLGISFLRTAKFKDAQTVFERAIAHRPDMSEAWSNLAFALHQQGEFDAALRAYDEASQLAPAVADIPYNKSITLLLQGKAQEGWPLYEARKLRLVEVSGVNRTGIRDLKYIAQAKGKSVLVDWEQGLGDTIQFCRFAKVIQESGAHVTLRVQQPLKAIIGSLSAEISVIGDQDDFSADSFRFHVQAMSVPRILKLREENIPFAKGYLSGDPVRSEWWHARLGGAGFKIGIAWQGNKKAKVDLGRSFSLEHFRALAGLPGVRLISLQKNDGTEELARLGAELRIETLGDDFDSGDQAFLDTAAVMENLDLIITSDTAIAHLAGALGRPCWVALQHVPDWRWMLDRSDSPWYDSLRLFRQTKRGDWEGVFLQMAEALREVLQTPAR